MSILKNLRAFAEGRIDEAALAEEENGELREDEVEELEDEEFMQECAAIAVPMAIQDILLGECSDNIDDDVKKAFLTVQDYLVGQGIISEAATVSISNPKINVVHLNKQSQLNRLKSIITVKLARKANHKSYKKYKLGQKIKKTNRAEMDKVFGKKAEMIAKKVWASTRKNGKVVATVEKQKAEKK